MELDTYGPLSPSEHFRSTEEIEAELGEQFRRARLRLELSQQDIARQANVSLTVVRNLERGRGARLSSIVKITAALGEIDTWLLALAPEPAVSPLEVLRAKGMLTERQRAPKRDALPEYVGERSAEKNPAIVAAADAAATAAATPVEQVRQPRPPRGRRREES